MNGDAGDTQTHQFKAAVGELLNLMVHSVYSETDVFLRELISNASDALDKVRYEAIARPELLTGEEKLAILVTPDAAAKTLTIADNGIGMDRQELIDNLGTLARSGTKAFLKELKDAKDGFGLIGQFGIGFYSAFMVADCISVTSRRAGMADAWTWTSTGGAGFEIASASDAEAANFGLRQHLEHDARYARAEDFIQAAYALWNSWGPDALVLDKQRGRFADASQVHRVATPRCYTTPPRTRSTVFPRRSALMRIMVRSRWWMLCSRPRPPITSSASKRMNVPCEPQTAGKAVQAQQARSRFQ